MNIFKPTRNPGFTKLFWRILPLLSVILPGFMLPGKLDASDFLLIAWNPGQELLTTGSVYPDYPYPLWTVLVMLPFTVWPVQVAMTLWFICNVLMFAASLALLISAFHWDLSPIWLATITLFSVFFLPVLTSMWLGQLTIFSLLILALTIRFFLQQQWTWLGIALGLSFIKPQAIILLAGSLLLWALCRRRWQVWAGFSAVIVILTLISIPFVSSPGQVIGGGISSHLETYLQRTSTIWGFFLSLGFPVIVPLAISLVLLASLGWIWIPFLRGMELNADQALFLFSAAILVNLIVIPYSWMHNLALLLPPSGYCITLTLKMNIKARVAWLALLLLALQPLMLGLFIMMNYKQSYQILPALIVLPAMSVLEIQTARKAV